MPTYVLRRVEKVEHYRSDVTWFNLTGDSIPIYPGGRSDEDHFPPGTTVLCHYENPNGRGFLGLARVVGFDENNRPKIDHPRSQGKGGYFRKPTAEDPILDERKLATCQVA